MQQFPRTTVGGVSLSRMLIGTNWLLGWSHTSASADEMIRRRYDSAEAFKPVLEAYLRHGVDTLMAPLGASPTWKSVAVPTRARPLSDKKLFWHVLLSFKCKSLPSGAFRAGGFFALI